MIIVTFAYEQSRTMINVYIINSYITNMTFLQCPYFNNDVFCQFVIIVQIGVIKKKLAVENRRRGRKNYVGNK